MKAGFAALGDVAEFINGAAFKPSDWGDVGKKIIRIQNLTDSSKPYNKTTRIVNKKLTVNYGDILVSWSATLGVFVWTEKDEAVLNQHIFKVIHNSKIIDKNYLRHCLHQALDAMTKHLHGATMKHVNRGEFLATQIPLPSLAEQQRIAALLDTADRILKQRELSIAKLDELERSVFLKLIDDFNIGDEIALSEVTLNVKNISPVHLFVDQKFTYIDIGSLSNETKSIISENMIIGIDAPSRARQEIKVNDILVSTVRPNLNAVAKVNRSYIKPVASTGFCVLRCDTTKILPQVVFSAVKSKKFIATMVNSATGASYPAVTDKIVKSYKLPKIAMNEQLKFTEFIALCEKKRIHLNAQTTKLKQLIQSLQHQSFAVN